MPEYTHVPVLAKPVLQQLAPTPGSVVLDGTTGLGGHSHMLGEAVGPNGRLICFDRDQEALRLAAVRLADLPCRVDFVNAQYEFMESELDHLGVDRVDAMLFDIGVSSLQFDKPERGFSLRANGPLDMRMDQSAPLTAADIINTWTQEQLADLFYRLGEERHSRRLAKRITEERTKSPIETTEVLARLAEECLGRRERIHPATRMFQALRIAVNDELGTLSRGLAAGGRRLAPGGRLAVITFHSLEDRIVKRTFAHWAQAGLVRLLTPKAVCPADEELDANHRARSAKLRVVQRMDTGVN